MKKVNVDRDELLRTLCENRKNHIEKYETATKARKEEVKSYLTDVLNRIENKPDYSPKESIRFPLPASHLADYDRAIKMVEMSVEPIIELDQTEFDQYVMDNWHWKGDFLTKSMVYGIR